MHAIYERKQGTNFPRTFEMGPGVQLGSMLRICNLKAWRSYKSIDVFERFIIPAITAPSAFSPPQFT
ncbi:unnamed protein product, partial [Ranitomeya imitator]